MTDSILKKIEVFLTYSDEKLEQLAKKNQSLKQEQIPERKNQEDA